MTRAQLRARVLARLDEDSTSPVSWTATEVHTALAEAERLFCLIALPLETTSTFTLSAGTTWYHALTQLPNFLLPLRLRVTSGARLRPARLVELDALNSAWQKTAGTPTRYHLLGIDLLAVTPQPAGSGVTLQVTHAYAPTPMASDAATPAIAPEYHQALIDYAVHALRIKEGGQEFLKTRPLLTRFLEDAIDCASYVRRRGLAQRYDRLPAELTRADISRLLGTLEQRRHTPWLITSASPQARALTSQQTN